MIRWYEDETNKCTWRYVNILLNKCGKTLACTCFGHFLWPSSSTYYTKYIFQRYENPMHKCKTVNLNCTVQNTW